MDRRHQHQQDRDSNHETDSAHQRDDSHDQHRVLDLDAEVFNANLAAVLDMTGVRAARSVVDLGAGTGAGSRLLRERYPDAKVTCVDNDPQMLKLVREQGFSVIEADLDEGFPELVNSLSEADPRPDNSVDLVWAASSLHHVTHPARLLSGIHGALAPNGVLVVVELATLPSFLSDPHGALLEQRCHNAATAEGWNHHPNWASVLETAGFAVNQSEVRTTASVTPAAREYAQKWFTRFSYLEALTIEDRAAVEDLMKRLPDDVALEPRTTRTLWVATPK